MIRICYRCQEAYGEKEPLDDKSETHGLCPVCLPKETEIIRRELDRIDRDRRAVGIKC